LEGIIDDDDDDRGPLLITINNWQFNHWEEIVGKMVKNYVFLGDSFVIITQMFDICPMKRMRTNNNKKENMNRETKKTNWNLTWNRRRFKKKFTKIKTGKSSKNSKK
jgi:CRISPR/Cas system-associated exonuclease Cas4 (RecB family)